MIDPLAETLLTFTQAAPRLPSLRAGRPVSPATLWRWATNGSRARDGSTVRLETLRIGNSTCTSLEAIKRFIARLSGDDVEAMAAAERQEAARA